MDGDVFRLHNPDCDGEFAPSNVFADRPPLSQSAAEDAPCLDVGVLDKHIRSTH